MTTVERDRPAGPVDSTPVDSSPAPTRRAGAREVHSVALPSEHGGWSLTVEPVVLGLIVAWSWSGLALGAAAVVAFVARTALKVVLVDRWRHRWLARTRLAARVVALEAGLLAVLFAVAAVGARGPFWVPLFVAAPLVAVELWFDMRSRSRRVVPELCGTVGIGSVAAAIVLADGGDTALAIGLWAVAAARAIAAVPYVRTQLVRSRGHAPALGPSDLAQAVAVATVGVAWLAGTIPLAPLAVIAGVAVLNGASVRTRPRPAVVTGIHQTLLGVVVVAVTAASVLLAR